MNPLDLLLAALAFTPIVAAVAVVVHFTLNDGE